MQILLYSREQMYKKKTQKIPVPVFKIGIYMWLKIKQKYQSHYISSLLEFINDLGFSTF